MTNPDRDGSVTLEISESDLYCLRTVAGQLIKGQDMNAGRIDGRRVGDRIEIKLKAKAGKR